MGMVELATLGWIRQRPTTDGRSVLIGKALLKSSGTPPTSLRAQQCHPAVDAYLAAFDFNDDGMVDLADFALFQQVIVGQ